MKYLFIVCLVLCQTARLPAQVTVVDSMTLYYEHNLLQNKFIQFFATKAMNDMYNFKFTKAENQYKWLQEKYPEHPLPYFLLGLSETWKMLPNPEDEQYDELALAYFDQAIDYAYKLQKGETENLEASFFLSAAYAFKSRIHADRAHWSRAIFTGRRALAHLRYIEKWEDISPEWLLGEGLYNYYAVWIRENYTLMRPVMAMFKRGNQKEGLKQLEKASENAFFVRIEALHFLMRIYRTEENIPDKAFTIAAYLNTTYPDNPYFQRYYVSCAYNQGNWQETQRVGLEVMAKIEQKMDGYEAVTGRYASYFLANVAMVYQGNTAEAKRYFDMTVAFAESVKAYDSGYYQAALLELGRIADREKDFKKAKSYYGKLRKHAKRNSKGYKEAKEKDKAYKRSKIED